MRLRVPLLALVLSGCTVLQLGDSGMRDTGPPADTAAGTGDDTGGFGGGDTGANGDTGLGGGGGGGSGAESVECDPCSSDAQCGDGVSAGCWLPDDNGNPAFCAVDCTDPGDTCPTGSTCVPDGGDAYSTCIPDAGTCDTGGTGSSGGGGTVDTTECETCSSDAECGDGVTQGCWLSDGVSSYCAVDCTDPGSTCPSGSSCMPDSGDAYSTCIPDAGTCDGWVDPGGSTGGTGGGTGGGGGTDTGQCTPDTWDSYARSFFSAECASCHGWATSLTGVRSRTSSNISRIQSNNMPPGGGLSSAEKDRIVLWLSCGAP